MFMLGYILNLKNVFLNYQAIFPTNKPLISVIKLIIFLICSLAIYY